MVVRLLTLIIHATCPGMHFSFFMLRGMFWFICIGIFTMSLDTIT